MKDNNREPVDNDTVDLNENDQNNTFDSSVNEQKNAAEAAKIKEERETQGNYVNTHERYTPDEDKEIPNYEAPPKISVGKILKYVAIGLVILVYALIFYRIYLQNNKGVEIVSQLVANSTTVKKYRDTVDSGEEFKVYSQTLDSYSLVLETDENKKPIKTTNVVHSEYSQSETYYGMFYICNFLYYESSEQVVITLRYNRSALNTLKDEYKEDSLPSEPFFFTLDDGKNFYDEYYYLSDKKFTYHYRRLIFDNVSLDDLSSLSLNIYYAKDCDDYMSPLEYIKIYDSNIPMKKVSKTASLEYFTEGLKKKPLLNAE